MTKLHLPHARKGDVVILTLGIAVLVGSLVVFHPGQSDYIIGWPNYIINSSMDVSWPAPQRTHCRVDVNYLFP